MCKLNVQGLALETRSAQIDGVLKALLSKLEKEKTTITLGDGDSQYCENFAITVFTRADRVDRAGRADKNTAMTFYAASIFFEVATCHVFFMKDSAGRYLFKQLCVGSLAMPPEAISAKAAAADSESVQNS